MYLLKKRGLVWQLLNELDPRVYRAYQLVYPLHIWCFSISRNQTEMQSLRINFVRFVTDKIIVNKGSWQVKD